MSEEKKPYPTVKHDCGIKEHESYCLKKYPLWGMVPRIEGALDDRARNIVCNYECGV